VRRILPIAGDVLVKLGDRVGAQDVVAQTLMPGDVVPVNLAGILGVAATEVPQALLKQVGERVEVGELLARTKGIFGLFKTEYRAKTAGQIESASAVTGQLILRGHPIAIQVRAFLAGEVVEVIPNEGVVVEADATFIQGIFGVGGEAYGPLVIATRDPARELTAGEIKPEMRGAIVVGGARMTGEAIREAARVGVSALISGGIDDQDLRDALGYDLGVAVTGSEKIGLTLIVTEGFGEIAMARRTFELLSSRAGAQTSVSGATQIRAGVMRPEIVIPIDPQAGTVSPDVVENHRLALGALVRIIRDPYFGRLGTVASLPHELRVLDSGSKARVLEVAFQGGGAAVVPRANVELIES
jgi:hypothetical protein